MITIHSVDNEGAINTRLWDNRACKFYDTSGAMIDIAVDIPEEEKKRLQQEREVGYECCESEHDDIKQAAREYYGRVRYGRSTLNKSSDIVSLRVQMGMRCNYHCQYCKQATHGKYDAHADIADARRFIANFGNICSSNRNEPLNIQLWGGEPLLYWPVMTMLGEFFRAEFPNSRITVLSNGSLINREKVEWFLKNKVVLAVSHDGPGQLDYRSGDPLADGSEQLEALRYYAAHSPEPLYFNAVITKNRYDLVGINSFIVGKIGRNVRVGFEGIVLVEDEAQFNADTMFEDADYLALRREITAQLISGRLNDVGMFRAKINAVMSAVIADRYYISDDAQQKCSMDNPYNLSVDLKGNVLACHSTPKPIGRVDNLGAADLGRIGFTHWSKREECKSCPILILCRGGCLAQDATAFFHSCNNEFHYNMIFFEVVYQLFFGEAIIAMDGVYRPSRQDFIRKRSCSGGEMC